MSADAVTARLDALEQARAQSTPGEWEQNGANGIHTPAGTCIALTHRGHARKPDAACIVAEHNACGDLIFAVRGVVELADRADDDADAYDSLATDYGLRGLEDDTRRCEERGRQYRQTATDIRAAVTAALSPAVCDA